MYQMVYFFVSYAMSYVFTRFLQKKNNEVEAIQENLYFDSEGIIEKEIDDESLEVGVEYGIYDPITPWKNKWWSWSNSRGWVVW